MKDFTIRKMFIRMYFKGIRIYIILIRGVKENGLILPGGQNPPNFVFSETFNTTRLEV